MRAGILTLLVLTGATCRASEVSQAANQLIQVLDSLHVEEHWPVGVHVNWETGIPDGKPEMAQGRHTHCSAFVASAAKHLGVYILRPPEHAQILLANAQYDWLSAGGEQRGWKLLTTALDAQEYANRGFLVVAAYKNHHDKPGHIAIVRPSDKSTAMILSEGPEITQAGGTNYRDTNLKQGFAGHPAAWGKNEVRYFAHSVDTGFIKG
jgi:hypothetical protein